MSDGKAIDKKTLLTELTLGDLAGVFMGLLKHHDEMSAVTGGGQLGKLTIEEFQKLMRGISESKLHRHAEAEQAITQRIFKDTNGLATAGTAFRMNTAKDADAFGETCHNYLMSNPGSAVVAVMAIVDSNGVYTSVK